MLKKESLDERQLLIRGDAFKYGFLTLLALLAFNGLSTALWGSPFFEGLWGPVFMIVAGVIAACLCMLRRDYYDFDLPGNRRIWAACLLCGVMSGALAAAEMLQGRFQWQGTCLAGEGVFHLLSALGCLLLGLYGLLKVRRYQKANLPE